MTIWVALIAWICWNVYIGTVQTKILLAGSLLVTGILLLVLSLGSAGVSSFTQVLLALSLLSLRPFNVSSEYTAAQSQ